MPKFQGIPSIPPEKVEQWQYDVMSALKENVEIMLGQRGPGRVITNDTLGVEPADRQTMKQLSARGNYYIISGVQVPAIADYINLLNDVQQLAIDVNNIQSALNALLVNMRA
tara:strand:+ start:4193 stop:4528 length:336 start_codon:yes stop_codon:yes gene_type:complete